MSYDLFLGMSERSRFEEVRLDLESMAITTNSSCCKCLQDFTFFYEQERCSVTTAMLEKSARRARMLLFIRKYLGVSLETETQPTDIPRKYHLCYTNHNIFYDVLEMKCSFHQQNGIFPTIYIDLKLVSKVLLVRITIQLGYFLLSLAHNVSQ